MGVLWGGTRAASLPGLSWILPLCSAAPGRVYPDDPQEDPAGPLPPTIMFQALVLPASFHSRGGRFDGPRTPTLECHSPFLVTVWYIDRLPPPRSFPDVFLEFRSHSRYSMYIDKYIARKAVDMVDRGVDRRRVQ